MPLSGVTAEGPRREFKITLGLRAGYGSAGRIYDLEEAVRTAHRWMWERATRGEPFLSGMFTRGEVACADSGGEAASHREPVAIGSFSMNWREGIVNLADPGRLFPALLGLSGAA
jgi:hypothetical protein